MALIEHFKDLTDPRIERYKRDKLIDIVTITICVQYVQYGILSHDTINRLFARLKPKEFQNAFIELGKISK